MHSNVLSDMLSEGTWDGLPFPGCSAQAVQGFLSFIYSCKSSAVEKLPLSPMKQVHEVMRLCHKFNCQDFLDQYEDHLASKVSEDGGAGSELWVSSPALLISSAQMHSQCIPIIIAYVMC